MAEVIRAARLADRRIDRCIYRGQTQYIHEDLKWQPL